MIQDESLNIRKLEYRKPRLTAKIPLDFKVDAHTFHGWCQDVSDSGIRARLDRPVSVGCSGSLTLHHRDGAVTRRARVVSLEGAEARLSFLPEDNLSLMPALTLVPPSQ